MNTASLAINLTFKNSCPNCGGDISAQRLAQGLLCENCLPQPVENDKICQYIENGNFLKYCYTLEQTEKFQQFFKQLTSHNLRNIQLMWARRFFQNISFALLAPTGVGKTTFGISLAAFLAKNNKKSYLLFPTQLIVNQVYERLTNLLGTDQGIVVYSSDILKSNKQKQQAKDRIKNADFSILITTTMFLYKNIDLIPKGIYELVFVDDVDSILKSAKNVDKVLSLLGFTEQQIQQTFDFILFRKKIFANGEPSEQQLQQYNQQKAQIEQIAAQRKGNLLVSSATANPKSQRIKLFTELLGFEVAKPAVTIRNIEDIYEIPDKDLWQRSVELIKQFGNGGLVFLSSDKTKEELKKYLQFLTENGIKVGTYENFEQHLEAFKNGEIQVLLGFASYRNPLARGLDLPQTVRYAIFVGVPKLIFPLDLQKPTSIYYFLLMIIPFLKRYELIDEQMEHQLQDYLIYLKKFQFIPEDKLLPQVKERIHKIGKFIENELLTPQILKAIDQSPDLSIIREQGQFKVITADITGYIQASGRTSRLYSLGLTKGLAYMLVDDLKAMTSLEKKARQFYEDITFKTANEVNLKQIFEQIDQDRQKVKLALSGKLTQEKDPLSTAMVIVESPNKARTIANFFGKPIRRKLGHIDVYEITTNNMLLNIVATKGHVFDLIKQDIDPQTNSYFGVIKIDENKFVPIFEPIDQDRQQIINSLRKIATEVQQIIVATDPDVEGEKIGYDVTVNLKPYQQNIVRAEFHEVSKKAFTEAVTSPRQISMPLVKAQLVRRISDRWVGFKISKHIQRQFNKPNLSAGRVQTPVLGWIINRADLAKQKDHFFGVRIYGGGKAYFLEILFKVPDYQKAVWLQEKTKFITIQFLQQQETELFEKPFATDTMLFAAAEKYGFSPHKTMQLAQDLFEAGLITYHRTDSIRVSANGINVAKQYITETFGEEYFSPRTFSTAGGAHECIRPVKPTDAEDLRTHLEISQRTDITNDHIKLYDLIFKKFMASQMRPTKVLKIQAKAVDFDLETQFSFIKRIIQDGYNKILPIRFYPKISEGKTQIDEKYKFVKSIPKAPPYTFATIISEMKNKGIGRPSTYAVTIQKLLERGYIIEKNGYLYPTKLGRQVYNELKAKEDYYRFVNEEFTRELEEKMDKVEQGEVGYLYVLGELFNELFEE